MRFVAPGLGALTLSFLLVFLPKEEGTKYQAYLDPVGVPTICSGSTTNVKIGDKADKAECERRLKQDIYNAWSVVANNVPRDVLLGMHHQTRAMFVSFVFHYGPGGKGVKDGFVYLKSGRPSTMITKLRAGDVAGACREFPKWNKNNLRGINDRNLRSEAICLEGIRKQQS